MTPTTHSRGDKRVFAAYSRMLWQRERYSEVYAVAAKYLPEPGPVEPTLPPYSRSDIRLSEIHGKRSDETARRQLWHLARMIRAGENRWSQMRLDIQRHTGK